MPHPRREGTAQQTTCHKIQSSSNMSQSEREADCWCLFMAVLGIVLGPALVILTVSLFPTKNVHQVSSDAPKHWNTYQYPTLPNAFYVVPVESNGELSKNWSGWIHGKWENAGQYQNYSFYKKFNPWYTHDSSTQKLVYHEYSATMYIPKSIQFWSKLDDNCMLLNADTSAFVEYDNCTFYRNGTKWFNGDCKPLTICFYNKSNDIYVKFLKHGPYYPHSRESKIIDSKNMKQFPSLSSETANVDKKNKISTFNKQFFWFWKDKFTNNLYDDFQVVGKWNFMDCLQIEKHVKLHIIQRILVLSLKYDSLFRILH